MGYGKRRAKQESLYAIIGEAILLARRRAGLSQKAVGQRLGITAAAVSDIERAVTRPNLDDLEEVADALEVSLGQIVSLEN